MAARLSRLGCLGADGQRFTGALTNAAWPYAQAAQRHAAVLAGLTFDPAPAVARGKRPTPPGAARRGSRACASRRGG